MKSKIVYLIEKIETLSPMHYKKLKPFLNYDQDGYVAESEAFLSRYCDYLESIDKTLDFGLDCYLQMVTDMNAERFDFMRSGKYNSSSFDEVNARVYANPSAMEAYMHGLIISQFLWKHHFAMFVYFRKQISRFADDVSNYLEIGAGHGLYLNKAREILGEMVRYDVVDVSRTSLDMARSFVDDPHIQYIHANVLDFQPLRHYDFITLGEVIEHVEDPVSLLAALKPMLNEGGKIFMTTPTNAPTIDHIYLFNNVDEIRAAVDDAELSIVDDHWLYVDDVSEEVAVKLKVTALYGSVLEAK
jgi:2-polyprenyl-3-methyl-5-hydroxy-6-metoxy-1,4-benzoquinol methylase